MTFKKLLLLTLLQWLVFCLLKIWLFNNDIFANPGVQQLFFWTIIAVVSAAFVRRLGVINLFECVFLQMLWVGLDLLLDLLITSLYTGLRIFSDWVYWAGYGIMVLAVFFAHKKRHVHIRREQAKHHHH